MVSGLEELTARLEADDASSRAIRANRLRDLLDILPVPPDGLSFLGGEESLICFTEIRRCYVHGSNMAVVLLCLAYVERELAAQLYAAGWEAAKKARLEEVLQRAYEDGVLSESECATFRQLARVRNSRAHFQGYPRLTTEAMVLRLFANKARAAEALAKDARRAVETMAKIVARQSGRRVVLGSPDE